MSVLKSRTQCRMACRFVSGEPTFAGASCNEEDARRQRTLRCVQSLDETAPFEVIDYRWIGEACSTDLTFNRSEKISTWLTSNNGT